MPDPIPTPRLTRADVLVAALVAAGLKATADVREATANLPGVLVTPPTLDYDLPVGATATWRLVVLAAAPLGNRDAWEQLDALLVQLGAVVDLKRAEPTAYKLPTGGDPLPAYLATFTEAVA